MDLNTFITGNLTDSQLKVSGNTLSPGPKRSSTIFGRIIDWYRRTPEESRAFKQATNQFLDALRRKYPSVDLNKYRQTLSGHLKEDSFGVVKPLTGHRAQAIANDVKIEATKLKQEALKVLKSEGFKEKVQQSLISRFQNQENFGKELEGQPRLLTTPSQKTISKITDLVISSLKTQVDTEQLGPSQLEDALAMAIASSPELRNYNKACISGAYAISRLPNGKELLTELNKEENFDQAREFLDVLSLHGERISENSDEVAREFNKWRNKEPNAFGELQREDFDKKRSASKPSGIPRFTSWDITAPLKNQLENQLNSVSNTADLEKEREIFLRDFRRSFKPVIGTTKPDDTQELDTSINTLCRESLHRSLGTEPTEESIIKLKANLFRSMHQGLAGDVFTILMTDQGFPVVNPSGSLGIQESLTLEGSKIRLKMSITHSTNELKEFQFHNGGISEQFGISKDKFNFSSSCDIELVFSPLPNGEILITCDKLSGFCRFSAPN